MHADDTLGMGDPGGDCGHRQRGGVAGEDRVWAAGVGQRREQLPLQLQVLRRRLDHQVAVGEVVDARGAAGSRTGRLDVLFAPTSLLRSLREGAAQPLDSACQRRRDRVVQAGLVAAQRRDLGDPGTHRAGTDDADPFDPCCHLPSNFGSRFSRKAFMPSTRSSVAIASS